MSDRIPNMDYDADEVIEGFKSRIKWPKKDAAVDVVITPPNIGLKIVLSIVITLAVAAVAYYALFPAINLKNSEFYMFLIAIVAIFIVVFYNICGARKLVERKEYVKRKSVVPGIIIAVILVVMLIGWLVGATLFRARDYADLMTVQTADFSEDFADINYDEVPRLDNRTAKVLADQQLGYLDEYMSQYVVSGTSTQINYKGAPVRVAYLEYADFFRWLNNTKDGLPAYMLIDLVTQKVQVVNCVDKFGEGIKYSPTELFNEKLMRHLRFQYPTALLDTPNFEIDDDAHPYWITAVLDKTIGLFGGTDVKGVIITDALNGESEYYSIDTVRTDENLNWIDVVYSEYLVVQQYNYHGRLSNGFWNSVFFQKDVNVTSNGNGNIALADDVWVYTGVTSSESDASNFGFILVNQRTKETRYYKNGGAMESSAQQSARDAVQNYGYNAIFPILLDIEGQPTYFMSLYGDSYTVKGYALVNLEDKTIVGTGLLDVAKSDAKALNAAVENYIDALKDKGKVGEDADADDYKVDETETDTSVIDDANTDTTTVPDEPLSVVSGAITDIRTSVNDGNTVYYLQLDGGAYYYIKVTDDMDVLLLNVGDTVEVSYESQADDSFIPAQSVTKQ